MPRIRGKFTPILDELDEDERWLMECTDNEKLLYFLVMMTIYKSNNSAPLDPRYYKVRYNLRQRLHTIRTGLEHIKERFPKLVCSHKKLSLLNFKGYVNRVDTKGVKEGERELEKEGEGEGKEPFPNPGYNSSLSPSQTLRHSFFQDFTEKDHVEIIEKYPKDFLQVRLPRYIETAEKKGFKFARREKIFQFLDEDLAEWQKFQNKDKALRKTDSLKQLQEWEKQASEPPAEFFEMKKKLLNRTSEGLSHGAA